MAQHIKNLFGSLIPQFATWKVTLIQNWNTVVGDLHEHVTLINIQHNMLILGVYDAAWLQELYILSPVLIKTINDYLGKEYVTNVRFKNIGYKKNEINLAHTRTNKKTLKRLEHIDLTQAEQSALTNIQDKTLRETLEKYLIRCKERE